MKILMVKGLKALPICFDSPSTDDLNNRAGRDDVLSWMTCKLKQLGLPD